MNQFSNSEVEMTMARLSPCETWMAIVDTSNIVIIYLPDFLSQEV